jgi:hypothetical protein
MTNPYVGHEDEVGVRIKDELKSMQLGQALLKKRFYDLGSLPGREAKGGPQ